MYGNDRTQIMNAEALRAAHSADADRTIMGGQRQMVAPANAKRRLIRWNAGHEQSFSSAAEFELGMANLKNMKQTHVVLCEPQPVRNGWQQTHVILGYRGARQKGDYFAKGEVWKEL